MTRSVTRVELSPTLERKLIDKIVDLAQYMGEVKFYPYQIPMARRIVKSVITNEGASITGLFSRQCIAENSLIIDINGNVLPIQKSPEAWKTKDSARILEVKTFGGHVLHCTEEHPVATPEGWVSAFCLKPGDKVVVLDKWEKFGDGVIDAGVQIHMTDDLAELVGWMTASINNSEEVVFFNGKERVEELLIKYFPDTWYKKTSNRLVVRLLSNSSLSIFLKKAMKYNADGFPTNVNCFTKSQLIRFFYPLFLLNGKSYKKTNTIKFILKGKNRVFLDYCKEHLNKLGLHGNYEIWIGEVLIFQCTTNFLRFKELFSEYLPAEFFPPLFISRRRKREIFYGENGEEFIYSKVYSTKYLEKEAPVWDITVPSTGWILVSGVKVHNSGKTQVVAMISAALMVLMPMLAEKFPNSFSLYGKGFWVGCFGPVGEQAVTMFDRIYDVFTTSSSKHFLIDELKIPVPAKGGARGNLISLRNKSLCRYQSSSRRAKVESKTYHLIVLDECQDMESFKVKKSILPMGAAVNATVVATGTTDVVIGYFYDTIEQNKALDVELPKDYHLHHEVDYTIAQKYNEYYRKYIKKEIKRLGIDSDEFKMAYRLIWPITKGMVFTKAQLEDKCYDKGLKPVKEYKDSPCIAGLDLGKTNDSTVLTIIMPLWDEADENGNMPKVLLDIMELEGNDWEEQYPKVVEVLNKYNIDTLVCDATGVGDPIRERYAILLPDVNVIPFKFSPSSKDTGYKYLIQEIANRRMKIPAHTRFRDSKRFKKFEQQMTMLKKNYTGKFLNPCPVDADKGHDDYPDSLMLAVYGTYYDVMPEMEFGDNDIFKTQREYSISPFKTMYSQPRRR